MCKWSLLFPSVHSLQGQVSYPVPSFSQKLLYLSAPQCPGMPGRAATLEDPDTV